MSTELEGQASTATNNWADAALAQLLTSYTKNFDIFRDYQLLGKTLPAFASFYSRGERYVLSKKAKLWAAECNEHALFFIFPHYGKEQLEEVTSLLEAAEQELVQPHDEHMYTYLSALILCQKADADAISMLQSYKFRKNYLLSIHGWCYGRLALYSLEDKQAYSNKDGKEPARLLSKTFEL